MCTLFRKIRIFMTHRFYVNSIIRIIEVQKPLLLTYLETLNFYCAKCLQFLKHKNYQKSEFKVAETCAVFFNFGSQKLITRKIWVAEKC